MISHSAQSAPSAHWKVMPDCPVDWQASLEACDAGFFHSPRGLAGGAPAGEPLFCVHAGPGGVDGVALGVRHACRLSRQARHVYFPSVPAVRDPATGSEMVGDLVAALRARGAAEVTMDSFDASWCPEFSGTASEVRRDEFVVGLDADTEAMLGRCSSHHRRYIRRGDRAGWEMRSHTGAEARKVLDLVQGAARARAESRGSPFGVPAVESFANERLESLAPWGATVFGAWDGDIVLAAMLVGWAGRRTYYVAGGGTPAGYSAGAGAWLHWKIATTLAAAGYVTYNLGGAPPGDTGDSGLRRFKEGFGPTMTECVGARWRLRMPHLRGHAALRLLTGGLSL